MARAQRAEAYGGEALRRCKENAVRWLILLCLLSGCRSANRVTAKREPPGGTSRASPLFEDVAQRSGVRFSHKNGADGHFYFIESTPAGCAMFDYDNDGWPDLLLVQSGPSAPAVAIRP